MPRAGREVALDALDFAGLIRPGALLVWGQAMAEPIALTSALMKQRAAIGDLRAFVGIGWSNSTALAHADHVRFSSYCGTGSNRALGHRLDIVPVHYSALAPLLAREAPILLLQLAAGRGDGHFTLGAAAEYLLDLLPAASLVIGEVNARAPRAGPPLRRDALDLFVHTDTPLAGSTRQDPGEVDRRVASNVANLIEDGATIQAGLGGIPAAVLAALAGHRDLGVHSGLIGDEIVALIEAGAVTNARKTIDAGLTVAGLLAGSARLSAWADANPSLALRPTSYTHDHAVLASIHRFTAVNAAIEVDLTGQINAEVAGGRYVGAVGGAVDFLRGAQAAPSGLPIIALPSTKGEASRIVPSLSGPVSTSRADAAIIVTEHGVVDLRGLGEKARIRRLIGIADPAHREALDRNAYRSR